MSEWSEAGNKCPICNGPFMEPLDSSLDICYKCGSHFESLSYSEMLSLWKEYNVKQKSPSDAA